MKTLRVQYVLLKNILESPVNLVLIKAYYILWVWPNLNPWLPQVALDDFPNFKDRLKCRYLS